MSKAPARAAGMAFAEPFPQRTPEEWRELAAAVVNKGAAPEDLLDAEQAIASLRTHLEGGVEVEPLYTAPADPPPLGLPAAMPFTRGRTVRDLDVPWDVRQVHDDPDAALTRAAVLADLENGVTSVWLHVGSDGLAAGDVAQALSDVRLDLAPVVVSSWDDQQGAAEALYAVLSGERASSGNLGLDPLGASARTGADADLSVLPDAVQRLSGTSEIRAITIDARVYGDAGASTADELGFALATGVSYLRALEAAGIGVAEAFRHIEFRVNVSADQFLSAAALRALRRAWARIGETVGVPAAERGARIHAVTTLRMFSREDAWTNILRSTLAVFGASLGGADAITVLPFDQVCGLPTPFSRRIARNTQILLAEESNVARVTDPAGGSWYVEQLTDDVARAAWAVFQEIEASGGMVEALAEGVVAQRIRDDVTRRDSALRTRQHLLTGVSAFPLAGEKRLERAPRHTLEVGPKALVPQRDARLFEDLRDRAAAFAKEHGHAPQVVVPVLTIPRGNDRRVEALNLLAIAGIEGIAASSADQGDAIGDEVGVGRNVVALQPNATGYDGVVKDVDVVAFLSDLLDQAGAPQ